MKTTASLLIATLLLTSANANDWPTWRGPNGDGKLPDSKPGDYLTEWSSEKSVQWKLDFPNAGNSSPIIIGDRLFLTQASDDGKARSLLCFETKTAVQLWKKTVPYPKKDPTHKTNPYCSASPTTDGEIVLAWHGNAGLHAYDLDGNEKWNRDLGQQYAHIWGPNAASPVIHGDHIFLHAGPGTAVRLYCLDKKTGDTVWEKPLPDAVSEDGPDQFKGSWATPLIIQNAGRTEMLIGLPQALTSFDPKTGDPLWHCRGLSNLCYTNPLVADGRAVYLCGYGGPGIALRLPENADSKGDITDTHRLWADQGKKPNRQRIGSGLIIGDHLFNLDEPGIAVCLDLKTGQKNWEHRLSRRSWSSMNLVGGKIYVNDQSGTTFVIEPNAEEFTLVSENKIGQREHTNSSLAFANGVIYQRTDTHLYAFAKYAKN